MRGWSFPIGRFLGVEVRIHAFFLMLLAISVGTGALPGSTATRGFVLWMMLLLAVVVREVARAVACAWFGLELRSILLLPTGGLLTYGTLDATERAADPKMQKRLAIVGPLASFGFALMLAGIIVVAAPAVNLIDRPWIVPTHLLRAAVWLNLLLGAVNLLPAFPLDGGRVARGGFTGQHGEIKGSRRAGALGQIIAVALILMGFALGNMWLAIMGAFVLIGAHMESQGLLVQNEVDTVLMRDVMLTQFSTLSASDTLEDALQRAVHTLQDVFPVVRGGNLVGAVSRQNIVEALASNGNSYVQGVMTKSFQTALPEDSLVKTLRRIMGEHGAQLVPVMEGERIVGIITPQNLAQSMGLLNQSRRLRRTEQ
jgi:Zn-dependent protease/CBS domain-containing protein